MCVLQEEVALVGSEGTKLTLLQKKNAFCLGSQFIHGSLQRINSPVIIIPAQEPAGEGGRFKPLLDDSNRSSLISDSWISLNVPFSCEQARRKAHQIMTAFVARSSNEALQKAHCMAET